MALPSKAQWAILPSSGPAAGTPMGASASNVPPLRVKGEPINGSGPATLSVPALTKIGRFCNTPAPTGSNVPPSTAHVTLSTLLVSSGSLIAHVLVPDLESTTGWVALTVIVFVVPLKVIAACGSKPTAVAVASMTVSAKVNPSGVPTALSTPFCIVSVPNWAERWVATTSSELSVTVTSVSGMTSASVAYQSEKLLIC